MSLVSLVWQTAGGVGEPPVDLVMAIALNLSVFTTQALMVDFERTPAQIGALTADIIKALLWRAVRTQPSGDSTTTDVVAPTADPAAEIVP
jgi:hypothetical protein